ncbi:phosphatidylinositol N-acetylglucosaminyltransferase subunit Q-like [Glandiceps talaboti]
MEARKVTRVFFPYSCLPSGDGVMIGWRDQKRKVVCVVGIITRPLDKQNVKSYLRKITLARKTNFAISVLGTWEKGCNVAANRKYDFIREEGSWVEMQTFTNNQDPPSCTLKGQCLNEPSLLILYDQTKLLNSRLENTKEKNGLLNGKSKSVDGTLSDVDCIFDVVNSIKTTVLCNDYADNLHIVHSQTYHGNGLTLWTLPVLIFYSVLLMIFSMFLRLSEFIFQNRLLQSKAVQSMIRLPATGCQLIERYCHLRYIVTVDKQLRDGQQSQHKTYPKLFISKGNLFCSIILDVILGVMVMLWLFHNDYPERLACQLLHSLDVVGAELQKLLEWLMGVPAGLKLNSQLDEFLGKFFLYHVYLWIGYLNILRPFMATILWSIGLSGCLGLSIFLSLVEDFLSMLTLHIYCFYVYAARLYNLQLSGLSSCWRLFRGKKWNVLRQRVDSCQYDVDQLFLGTILFTVLLFLLPTTALYYIVFTSFRLLVLLLDSLLANTVITLNTFPVFSLLLRLFHSDMLAGGVRFTVIDRIQGHPLCLSMQVEPAPYSIVLKEGQMKRLDTWRDLQTNSESIGGVSRRLLLGHLVYPWGGDKKK